MATIISIVGAADSGKTKSIRDLYVKMGGVLPKTWDIRYCNPTLVYR